MFLSIDDSLELTDEQWQKWFGEPLPSDENGNHNLRWMPKFIKKNSTALQDILQHFESHSEDNKIEAYIHELRKYKRKQ
ncbi:MAG: hypothetical protein GWO20_04055 [Candidatus Korarchaeota archaeon]|nr:hypothetical protein [Candidatus Korarchaeota archaeon]NIU83214.1 hypothetical protein [Candidatus Thorarchaeota archaeon]NIW13578.1 hypothetical protein [Candidatus Thorarchaeota archaeon]NIW51687.1 hypothetical protein [Candidatus Korarchaeota archaeon]